MCSRLNIRCGRSETCCKFLKCVFRFRGQNSVQRSRQDRGRYSLLPALRLVTQIGATSVELSCGIDPDVTLRSPHDARQRPLGIALPARHAGPDRHVLLTHRSGLLASHWCVRGRQFHSFATPYDMRDSLADSSAAEPSGSPSSNGNCSPDSLSNRARSSRS